MPYRVLQAVGLAALTTCLVAIYFRQQKLSAIHIHLNTHEMEHRDVIPGDKQKTTVKALPALAEPWGSHHMFLRQAPYDPCPKQFIEGTWTSKRSMGNATLPLTLEAQREIHEHQHPPDCSKAKYLVYAVHPNGIGAVFHVTGVALHLALDLGRVFVEQSGTFLTGHPKCNGKDTLDSCYFLPFSGCRPTEEQMKSAVTISFEDENLLVQPGADPTTLHANAAVVIATHGALVKIRAAAPRRFQARLSATAMDPKKHYYWWRAQSVAYMLRPRPEVLADLEERRSRLLAGPTPLPGCISVHVRHGDKGVEAEVFEDKMYDEIAAKLRALAPSYFTDQLFVSTEDPETINYFVNQTNGKWHTGYTAGVPRKPDRHRPNLAYMAEIGYYEEMLNSLLNLDLALECSGFVGSIFSNWVRLIDELRATMRCKANAVFADVHYQNPHEMDVNW
ncbi:hypothetical protein VOLCADRAFT_107370 [Volvox carteri f. nagariensis]|uniref:Fucosyltransferase n=1 Tax=Volvox carteri f. nagariensis TaxID=3068 RepID=D8UDK6_VOLCA|nr:uncharacterized protein VOLCADRAFT_107370 [Volvox carteri f. nagariensis]EFJ42210.1 hypothetical protein VOLCADRAFT_107370 [Volvox carteri f. nagariensis]|eukprot:XP_002956753.1 hypothetical protein VOLCADRAFT_107370 [Volvox carteri f. nagariensis]